MYSKYIYFMLSILQILSPIYVCIKNMLPLYIWYSNLEYLKSAKLILCLINITVIVRKYCSAEVKIFRKIYGSLIALKRNCFKYTSGTL